MRSRDQQLAGRWRRPPHFTAPGAGRAGRYFRPVQRPKRNASSSRLSSVRSGITNGRMRSYASYPAHRLRCRAMAHAASASGAVIAGCDAPTRPRWTAPRRADKCANHAALPVARGATCRIPTPLRRVRSGPTGSHHAGRIAFTPPPKARCNNVAAAFNPGLQIAHMQ